MCLYLDDTEGSFGCLNTAGIPASSTGSARPVGAAPTSIPCCRLDTPCAEKDPCLVSPFPVDPRGNKKSSPESCFCLPSPLAHRLVRLRKARHGG